MPSASSSCLETCLSGDEEAIGGTECGYLIFAAHIDGRLPALPRLFQGITQ